MKDMERISNVVDGLVLQAGQSAAQGGVVDGGAAEVVTDVAVDIARFSGVEVAAFERLFARYMGGSFERFLGGLTCNYARELLGGKDVGMFEVAPEAEAAELAGLAGFSGQAGQTGLAGIGGKRGRANDSFVKILPATTEELRQKGQGLRVVYGVGPSPFGELILARTPKGVCYVGFLVDGAWDACLARIFKAWPRAEFVHDDAGVAADLQAVVDICMGVKGAKPVNLHVYGTEFQMRVWRALLKIPMGALVTYQSVGNAIGAKKGAARAIGGAVGANPVSLLIPCHRVVQGTGALRNYGWGDARKKALLSVECVLVDKM